MRGWVEWAGLLDSESQKVSFMDNKVQRSNMTICDTFKVLCLASTGAFYYFATSREHRDFLSYHVFKVFYQSEEEILALRRGHALEVL